MPALDLDTDAQQIAHRLRDGGTLLVACLCAQWCGTCRDYRATFGRLADAHPTVCFAWIDVETHADRLDDLDVENFPTLLIEDASTARFFGAVLPHGAVVERMLSDPRALPGVHDAPRLRALLASA